LLLSFPLSKQPPYTLTGVKSSSGVEKCNFNMKRTVNCLSLTSNIFVCSSVWLLELLSRHFECLLTFIIRLTQLSKRNFELPILLLDLKIIKLSRRLKEPICLLVHRPSCSYFNEACVERVWTHGSVHSKPFQLWRDAHYVTWHH